MSEKLYEELCVNKLKGKYGPRAVRFVARVGAKKAGWATRGEACALAKKNLFLTHTDPAVLVKPSERAAKNAPRRVCCCDYVQLNPISSCPFQCLYCFESDLRGYDNPFMRFYVNFGDMHAVLTRLDRGDLPGKFRAIGDSCWTSVNMGEHADSLAQENIFRVLPEVVPWFQEFRKLRLLLLTKGDNVDDLPATPPENKVAMAFSVNTTAASDVLEIGAPSPAKRLVALRAAREKGYMVAIRLDPLVAWPDDWKGDLEDLMDLIHRVAPDDLVEITVGTMRYRPHQTALFTQMVASTRVETPVGGLYGDRAIGKAMSRLYGLQAEVVKGFSDNYYRRPFEERKEIYRVVVDLVKGRRPKMRVTLCQEERAMYDAVKGSSLPGRCNCMVGRW